MNFSTRTLTVLAVLTNPLVWLAACVFVVYVVLHVMVLYLASEWSMPQPVRPKGPMPPTHEPLPLDEWPPAQPSPALVVRLDEYGRPEVLVDDEMLPTQPAAPARKRAATRATASQTARPTKARTKAKPKKKARAKKTCGPAVGG